MGNRRSGGRPLTNDKLQDACAQLWLDLRHAAATLPSLIVTGCGGGEGVSTIAFSLGGAALRIGSSRVLVIDASPSSNGLSETLASGSGRGLRQFQVSDPDLIGLIKPIAAGYDLLPIGAGGRATLPSDQDLSLLQARALESYDVVIWDVPPVTDSIEAKRLITLFGNVVLVTETDRTPCAQVIAALDEIRALSAEPLAVLRNRAARAVFGFGTRRD
ncbi:cellulose synthase operon protein YhjQ/BcsQ [Pseudorhodobacter sp.]|uniref:cellulose synthase operon protein YhjQ/BcsQ n=1 Tax=Pseudorhodobacter sp. TaxID=1934400 RepID=UPI002647D130|nr:cellulose synthase operon protein YhjQ/BcsQ [Pseudorhodobacter sp.]MDN5785903.1 hypothetical protein [Pseudorhodobacter sp.]